MLLFKYWLEANESDVEIAKNIGPHDNLERLFKNRLRVVFPLKYNRNYELEKLVSNQNKYQFDFLAGKAYKNAIDGRGKIKKQEIKLTRALNDLDPKLVDLYINSNLSVVVKEN